MVRNWHVKTYRIERSKTLYTLRFYAAIGSSTVSAFSTFKPFIWSTAF